MPTMADWSTTAASNGTTSGVNIAENCPAANMNNWGREIMAQLRSAVTTGTATISGNASVGGTLTVTGGMTFNSTLGIAGATTLSSTLAVTGAGTFSSTLTVTGGAVFNGNATVASQLNIASNALFQHNGTDGFLRTVTGKLYLGAGGNNHLSIDGTTGDIALLAAENFQFNSGNLQWSSLANFSIGPNSGVPLLAWDSGDYISYDRSINTMYFSIGNASKLILTASGVFDGNAVELGYKDCPQVAITGAATLALAHRGCDLYLTNSGALTIPPNSSVPFPLGTVIPFTNDGSARTLTQGAGVTLKWGGVGTSGNRTLGAGSMGAIKKVGTDTWYVSGAGVS